MAIKLMTSYIVNYRFLIRDLSPADIQIYEIVTDTTNAGKIAAYYVKIILILG